MDIQSGFAESKSVTSSHRTSDRFPRGAEALPEGAPASTEGQPSGFVSAFMPFEPAPSSSAGDRLPPASMPPASMPPSRLAQSIPPSRLAPPAPPVSTVQPAAPRRSSGGIYQVVRQVERKHGSFFISRLILMTGINLRTFDASTHDDPIAVDKLVKALRTLVPAAELSGLLQLLPSQQR